MQQLIATPLRGWNLGEVELQSGLKVVNASSLNDLDIQFFPSLSLRELERIQRREYWLSLVADEPQDETPARTDAASPIAMR